jgi:hypothetical protein
MPASNAAPAMPVAALKAELNTLLSEHVYLAAATTGAALGGRQGEFQAAAGALDKNSVDVSKAIGMVYGGGAESAFLALWRKHIGFVVDYTTGIAQVSAHAGRTTGRSDGSTADGSPVLRFYVRRFGPCSLCILGLFRSALLGIRFT